MGKGRAYSIHGYYKTGETSAESRMGRKGMKQKDDFKLLSTEAEHHS